MSKTEYYRLAAAVWAGNAVVWVCAFVRSLVRDPAGNPMVPGTIAALSAGVVVWCWLAATSDRSGSGG